MSKGIIIAGTSPEVGKTYITALFVKAMNNYRLNCGYYKAVVCGAMPTEEGLISPEASFVCAEGSLKTKPLFHVSYIYKSSAAPHLAALQAGIPIEAEKIKTDFQKISQKYDYVCMETNGGLMCPLRIDGDKTLMMSDIMQELNLPLVLVASLETDNLNHVLLTIQYIRSKHLPLKGIILNHFQPESAFSQDKVKEFEETLDVPILCTVAECEQTMPLSKEELLALFVD